MAKIEVKGLSVTDLEAKASQLKADLKKLEFNHAISPIENPNVITETRRNIARVLTELNIQKNA